MVYRRAKRYVRTGRRIAYGAAATAYGLLRGQKRKSYSRSGSVVSTRKRFKGHGSYVKTKKKHTSNRPPIKQGITGRSGTSLIFSARKYSPKFLKFISARQTLSTTNAEGIANSAKLATYTHMSVLDKADMNWIIDAASRQKTYDANSTTWSPIALNEKDYKVYLMSGSAEYRLANNSHHPMELIIYAYKCKNDSDAGPGSMMNAHIQSGGGFGGGLNAGALSGADTLTAQYIGVYPHDSAAFRRFYHVVEQEKITLNPGQTHVYRQYCRWNKIMGLQMRYGDGENQLRDNWHYKGYTGGAMFRISGFPIHSQTTGGEHANVQLSVTRLDIVMIKRYNYRIMCASRDHFEVKDYQDNFTTGGEWYDPGSGVMEKVVAGVVSATTDET